MRQFLARLALLFVVVLVIFGVYRLLTIRPLDNVDFFRGQPLLVALDGRGAGQTQGYSAAALDAARQAGANGLYLPVFMTRDGVLVVSDVAVDQLSLAELRARDVADGVLTLQDALAQHPDLRAVVTLQQPSLQALAALLQAIDANDARPRVLAVVDHPLLADTLREQAPDLGTAATSAETRAFLATKRFRLTPFYRPAAPALLLPGSQINKQLVDAARSRGIHLIALADQQSLAALQALVDAGVDGVIVAEPALLTDLRGLIQAP